jgi:fructosamine-3-kinase
MITQALSQALTQTLSQVTHENYEFKNALSISGGDINQAYKLTFQIQQTDDRRSVVEHRTYFIKINQADGLGPTFGHRLSMFESEATGLTQLAQTQTIRVPSPICHGIHENYAYLVLEYLPLVSLTDRTSHELGRKLAELHLTSGATAFGWQQSNTIGTTSQPNPWTANWGEFWQVSRIGHQLQLAKQKGGKFPQGDRFLDHIPELLKNHSPKPSLVHGDLWGGNAGALATGEPVIFDPAVYWGDREVDLAMTELFGGFGSAFYKGYESVYPIDPGYAKRKTLYNLYHILNHYNLFGGSYGVQADRMMAGLLN